MALADQAISTLKMGLHGPSQALAVVIAETLISRGWTHNYKQAQRRATFDEDTVTLSDLTAALAVAPIEAFYTSWRPDQGTPPPDALGRHVSIHQADKGHYTEANAVIAVMLMASVMKALSSGE